MRRSAFSARNVLLASVLASGFLLSACSSDDDDDTSGDVASAIEANSVLSGTPTIADNSISGDGSIIFTNSLGAVDSGRHFQVAAVTKVKASPFTPMPMISWPTA